MKFISSYLVIFLVLTGFLEVSSATVKDSSVGISANTPPEVYDFINSKLLDFFHRRKIKGWTSVLSAEGHKNLVDAEELSSGLQVKALKKNSDPAAKKPTLESYVEVNYRGFLSNGTTFYDGWLKESPSLFQTSSVVRGWQEALLLMNEGDIYEFYLPSQIAYAEKGAGKSIPAHTDLIFIIQLISVDPEMSLWLQTKLLLKEDFIIPPFKNYHLIVIGLYLIFRKGSKRLTQYLIGNYGPSGTKLSARVRHILLPDEAKAQAAKYKEMLLKNPEKFSEIAKEHSKCPSGSKGGDLGQFSQGAMVPEFDKVVFDPKSPEGEVIGPVKTQFGYHLIMIDERKGMSITETKEQKASKKDQ